MINCIDEKGNFIGESSGYYFEYGLTLDTMSFRFYLLYYFIAFFIACLTFHVVCIHNLRLEVDYGLSYFAHMFIFEGLVFFFNLVLIHFIVPKWKTDVQIIQKIALILLSGLFYCLVFYMNQYAVQMLPDHFIGSRMRVPFFIPVGNLMYFEQSLIQLFPVALWCSVLYLMIIPIKKYTLKVKQYFKSQQQLDSSKVSLLRMKMNPHFLFNELNNIHSLAILNDQRYHQYIDHSIDLTQMILQDAEGLSIPIEMEIRSIEKYIQLQKIRFDNTIKINFSSSHNFKGYEVPPMVLMTLVENAIKHCDLSKMIGDCHVDIQLKLVNDSFSFQTRNSYNAKVQKKPGIGLKQLKERLEILYPNRYQIFKQSKQDYYEVVLKIELDERHQ